MAVTITVTRQKVAGSDVAVSGNLASEILVLTGSSVANTDTGTYTPTRKPLIASNGNPLVIGLPHNVIPTINTSTGVITFTNSTGGALTNANFRVQLLVEK